MSIEVMNLVWFASDSKGGLLNVELCLADFADADGGSIFPSVNTIAQRCRIAPRNVRNHLRSLESSRWLVCIDNFNGGRRIGSSYQGTPRHYQINQMWLAAARRAYGKREKRQYVAKIDPSEWTNADKRDSAKADDSDTLRRMLSTFKADDSDTLRRMPASSEPSGTINNHQENPHVDDARSSTREICVVCQKLTGWVFSEKHCGRLCPLCYANAERDAA